MLSALSQNKPYFKRSLLLELANHDRSFAVKVLGNESLFETLSFDNVLGIASHHEVIVLPFLANPKHWEKCDGLALSILGEKSVKAALFILSQPELRRKLVGLDLARLGSGLPTVAAAILHDDELRPLLKSIHIAMLGENDLATATHILQNPELRKLVEPCDLWRLCKNHPTIAKELYADKALIRKLDGGSLALMVEYHEDLIYKLLGDINRTEQLDPNAFPTIGRRFENIARLLYSNTEYVRRMGALGVARMAKYHEKFALDVLKNLGAIDQFLAAQKGCFEQISEMHLSVAEYVYAHFKDKISLDELVMIGKSHLSIAQKILLDPTLRSQLTGKQLVNLGFHVPIAIDILKDADLKQRVTGHTGGLLGIHDEKLSEVIMCDDLLKEGLLQLDLTNLCKNFLYITRLVIFDANLRAIVKEHYVDYLKARLNTVVALCSFVQCSFKELQVNEEVFSQMASSTPYSFPMLTTTQSRKPVPKVDDDFVAKYQSMLRT